MKKHQNTLTQDMEGKIISIYAKGMTTGDMESHVRELYGLELSDSTISRITEKHIAHSPGMAAEAAGEYICGDIP